jgi:hypothetical protein
MKRLALTVLAVLLLAGGSLVRPAGAEDAKPLAPASLHDAWKTVEGRSGRLRHDEKGYVFAVSLRDKVGEVVVESVGSDCVVLVGQGSGEKWHSVLPLVRVELQIYR